MLVDRQNANVPENNLENPKPDADERRSTLIFCFICENLRESASRKDLSVNQGRDL